MLKLEEYTIIPHRDWEGPVTDQPVTLLLKCYDVRGILSIRASLAPRVLALIDPSLEPVPYRFEFFSTGDEVPPETISRRYLGTIEVEEFNRHVFVSPAVAVIGEMPDTEPDES